MSFSPLTWNAFQRAIGPNRKQSRFHGGHVCYRKPGQSWQAIDTTIANDLSCSTFGASVQFPADSQGWATIEIDGAFSMSRHIAEKDGTNSEPSLSIQSAAECPHQVAGVIDRQNPQQIIYPLAWPGADLIRGIEQGRSTRIASFIRIRRAPAGTGAVPYSFLLRSADAQFRVAGQNGRLPLGSGRGEAAEIIAREAAVTKGDSTLRGMTLRKPEAWYTLPNGRRISQHIRVKFERVDFETVRLTKFIPRDLIDAAMSAGVSVFSDDVFYPDANPESAGFDGIVKGSGGSWATTLASSGNYSDDSGASGSIIAEATASSNVYGQYRHAIYVIDCSSIGSGQRVDALTFTSRMDNQRITGTMGLSTNIYSSSPASNTAIANADYMAVGSTPFTDSPRLMLNESFDNPWVTQTLNSAGRAALDVTGYLKIALGVVEAHESGSPTWASNNSAIISLSMADSGANAPYIDVTHSTVSTSSPAALLMR